MKRLLAAVGAASLSASLAACATAPTTPYDDPAFPAASVSARLETPVMASIGDSADDAAIWIGEGDGFIIGTDKQSGLYVYELDGTQRDYLRWGTLNNVDLRGGYTFQGREHVLLVASNDETRAVEIFLYDPEARDFVRPDGHAVSTGKVSPYGICLGRGANGNYHVGVTTKAGIYYQHIVEQANDTFGLRQVREFSTGTKTEGCAFDDRTGTLYIAEEEGGLYRYPAAPSGKDGQIVVARTGDYGAAADFEGVAVYESGANAGYVLVSAQGNDSYAAFRLPGHEFAGRFRIANGAVDGTSTTDGIAITSQPTARFPQGFLVVQDDEDDTSPGGDDKRQNFKIVDWRDIAAVLE